MQKVQMGGGAISPAVAAHVQKSALQPKPATSGSKAPSTTQIGGGIISPNVSSHVAQCEKVALGGGAIHPNIAKHLRTQ